MSNKSIRISKKIMGKKLDGEWVFLNLTNGEYYGLNETGSLIWEELKSKGNIEAVLERLEQTFDVDRAVLEKDLRKFLEELQKEGLAKIETAAP